MTNLKYLPVLTLLIFLLGLTVGYYSHEVQDQKEIQIEAYKIYQDNMNLSKNKFIEKFNISTCGEINGR